MNDLPQHVFTIIFKDINLVNLTWLPPKALPPPSDQRSLLRPKDSCLQLHGRY